MVEGISKLQKMDQWRLGTLETIHPVQGLFVEEEAVVLLPINTDNLVRDNGVQVLSIRGV